MISRIIKDEVCVLSTEADGCENHTAALIILNIMR